MKMEPSGAKVTEADKEYEVDDLGNRESWFQGAEKHKGVDP